MGSPYLKPYRLSDVVGAIQIMGAYPWATREIDHWRRTLDRPQSVDEDKHQTWKEIFREHPEFFRLDPKEGLATLRWRWVYDKNYHVRERKEVDRQEKARLITEE